MDQKHSKIALVTYQDDGAYHSSTVLNEDQQLVDYLKKMGFLPQLEIWNNPTVNWRNFDLVILKSPWDYFNQIEEFRNWLSKLAEGQIPMLNPISMVQWNADKHYLLDIEAAGLAIAPCHFLESGDSLELSSYFQSLACEQFIIKPAVSGGAKHTYLVDKHNVTNTAEIIGNLLEKESFIIQPYIKEIVEDGEWSFLFFGGKFSHAVLKKAKSGDFRVQHAHGGTVESPEIPLDWIDTAQEYVDQFAKNSLYARVDGVFKAGKFLLIELELIEPFLFLNYHEKSFENYATALKLLTQ